MHWQDKIIAREAVRPLLERRSAPPGTLVQASGCFDLLHYGHLLYLEYARSLGHILVVSINSDASIRLLKGPTRPFMPEYHRAALLAALSMVDFVVQFDEPTAERTVEVLRPDFFVKGTDYSPERVLERAAVERHGGVVVIAPTPKTYSSNEVVNRLIAENAS